MLLKLENSTVPMKMVFLLSEELKKNPERVALTQALTLDTSKPTLGLKGTNGLFGSKEWWDSIGQGRIPLLFISGIIKKVYVAGQDPSNFNNTVDLLQEDGTIQTVGIYTNRKADSKLFKIGYKASIVYALDEMKQQPDVDGSINRSKTALEMAVSLEPIE